MRRIGSVSNEQQAQTLRDYLFTRDVETRIDQADDGWDVWVLDEDCLETARGELAEFQANPLAEKYASASRQAQSRRQARLNEELEARKRQINLRERWERPVYQRVPVTILLIVASVGVTMATNFGKKRELTNLIYIQHVDYAAGSYKTTLPDVRNGEVWRLVTPIFLHLSWLHIAMNMYMLFLFGASIEEPKGPWRYLAYVLIIGAASNLAQFFMSGPMFGGMSGVDFGLFGYLWMKSKFAPEEGFFIPKYLVIQLFVFTLLCMSGIIPNIANTAHLVGLATGMVISLVPIVVRNVRGR